MIIHQKLKSRREWQELKTKEKIQMFLIWALLQLKLRISLSLVSLAPCATRKEIKVILLWCGTGKFHNVT